MRSRGERLTSSLSFTIYDEGEEGKQGCFHDNTGKQRGETKLQDKSEKNKLQEEKEDTASFSFSSLSRTRRSSLSLTPDS